MKPAPHIAAQLLHSTSAPSTCRALTASHKHMGQIVIKCSIMLICMKNDTTPLSIFFSEDQRCCDRYNKIHAIQYKKNKMVEYYYILNYLWQDLLKISLCKHSTILAEQLRLDEHYMIVRVQLNLSIHEYLHTQTGILIHLLLLPHYCQFFFYFIIRHTLQTSLAFITVLVMQRNEFSFVGALIPFM